MFNAIVLLAPGGKVVYSGPTGQNAQTVTSYFDRFDVHCPPDANVRFIARVPSARCTDDEFELFTPQPAEFLIDTVAPVGGSKVRHQPILTLFRLAVLMRSIATGRLAGPLEGVA